MNPWQDPSHELGWLTWVDSSQHMDKNNYYYSFKTQVKS